MKYDRRPSVTEPPWYPEELSSGLDQEHPSPGRGCSWHDTEAQLLLRKAFSGGFSEMFPEQAHFTWFPFLTHPGFEASLKTLHVSESGIWEFRISEQTEAAEFVIFDQLF